MQVSTRIETIGDRVRKRRLDLGLLQKEVADQLGVDLNTVHNWECNKTTPQLGFLPRVIRVIGYDPHSV